jgi:hypothetical protein
LALYFLPKWQPSFATLISFYLIFYFIFIVVVFCPFHLYLMTFVFCVCVFLWVFVHQHVPFNFNYCMVMVLLNFITWLHGLFYFTFSLHCKFFCYNFSFFPYFFYFVFFCLSMFSMYQLASKRLCSKNVENYIDEVIINLFLNY